MTDATKPTDRETYVQRVPRDPTTTLDALTSGQGGIAFELNNPAALLGVKKELQKQGVTMSVTFGGGIVHGLDGAPQGTGAGARVRFKY